jgi:hypothetical protein
MPMDELEAARAEWRRLEGERVRLCAEIDALPGQPTKSPLWMRRARLLVEWRTAKMRLVRMEAALLPPDDEQGAGAQ